MSVLIKRMEMPKNCMECDLKSWNPDEYDYVCPFSGIMALNIGRQNDCPLVEVPTPHGRLIDETIVLEMIRKSMGIKDLSFLYHAEKSVVNEIFHAPTVIEAEGEA
jgi:hypothetical protein